MRHGKRLLADVVFWPVILAGVAALGYSVYKLQYEPVRADWMLLLAFMTLLASRIDVRLPGIASKMTLTDTFIYVCALVLNPWAATVLASVDGLATSLANARRATTVGINLAVMNLSILGASLITTQMFGPLDRLVYGEGLLNLFAMALGLLALLTYLMNTGLIAVVVAAERRQNVFKVWFENYLCTSGAFFAGMVAAGLISKGISVFGFYSVFISAPILALTYVSYHTYLKKVEASNKHIEKLNKLHLATIESLTMAIDAKDELTRGHIQRVLGLAEKLARAVGYPEEQVEGLKVGALLHDIGKLAVPEHILNKPGKLSSAEYSKIMIHPVVGADILSNVEFPYEVVPIVKHHHEKYDGTGYPSGLRGEEIPMGARILTVVDCYDALTTSRSYRPRFSREQALDLMRRESGRTFDPAVLEKFLGIIDEIEEDIPSPLYPVLSTDLEPLHTDRLLDYGQAPAPPRTRTEKALRDIAAAQREALSIYEISQTLGTTLQLSDVLQMVAAKLEMVANFTTLVIYLKDGKGIKAAYALGKNKEALQGAHISLGEGCAGWVAEHRQVLIGGSPLVDLEPSIGRAAAAYRSMAIFPLAREAQLIGALALYSEQDRGYSTDEVRLLETISSHAATALDNALMFERTQEFALTDNLTGLPNSRYLYNFFDQERGRAERYGEPLVIMMMDLDGFKRVNDTHGHHMGNEILKRIAGVARAQLRAGDTLIRYAGDEFVAVLHRASAEVVKELKQRLQSAIDEASPEKGASRQTGVGISIGYATFFEDGNSLDELLMVADRRMYEDKLARKQGFATARLAAVN